VCRPSVSTLTVARAMPVRGVSKTVLLGEELGCPERARGDGEGRSNGAGVCLRQRIRLRFGVTPTAAVLLLSAGTLDAEADRPDRVYIHAKYRRHLEANDCQLINSRNLSASNPAPWTCWWLKQLPEAGELPTVEGQLALRDQLYLNGTVDIIAVPT
jgi:hypothetical protein